jgi:precorrin-3B methylase
LSSDAATALLSGNSARIDAVLANEMGTMPSMRLPKRRQDATGGLTVVGVGITLGHHVTLDALQEIQSADRIIYLIPTPGIVAWLIRQNPNVASLADAYHPQRQRKETYGEMVDRVLAAVRAGERVCFAISGHPGVAVYASHAAIRRAREEGFAARMIPGISAEAVLVADLGIDPVDLGWQSIEATDFVANDHRIDTAVGLILWQIGVVGITTAWQTRDPYIPGVERLIEVLTRYYPGELYVVVYEAATYPVCEPVMDTVKVKDLASARITPSTTLFVPPSTARVRRSY